MAALKKITEIIDTPVLVRGDDIDTDRIIPARFLKSITFEGLGKFAFYDERKNTDGTDKAHPLNDPRFENAGIMISGMNFGCGSSREHAPQALWRRGIHAIIAGSFAEIFFGNSTTLGIACLVAKKDDLEKLSIWVEKNPCEKIAIDITRLTVSFGDNKISVSIPESVQKALIEGRWDPIADLLENSDKIQSVDKKLNIL